MSKVEKDMYTKNDFRKEDWTDWRWQMSNSIRTLDELSEWIKISEDEVKGVEGTSKEYKWRITPYYASIMDKEDPSCPIRKQAIPKKGEVTRFNNSAKDPVGDKIHRETNRVVHKYPDRVIFLVTELCPVYCRHCTRKFHTTNKNNTYFRDDESEPFEEDISYIKNNESIRDVLLTGGDPLTYSDDKLEHLISSLRKIDHVDILRIGSRYPVLLPQRITPSLCSMLNKYQPIWFATHFNHPSELTTESVEACNLLAEHGIPVLNQTVLLNGVNDSIGIMKNLMEELIKVRIRPYYLYHCDNVTGVSHFRTSLKKGREIIEGLLGRLTGFAVPKYVSATRIGKVPLERSFVHSSDEKMYLENYEGKFIEVSDGLDASRERRSDDDE